MKSLRDMECFFSVIFNMKRKRNGILESYRTVGNELKEARKKKWGREAT